MSQLQQRTQRDLRLDFFRGMAMLIIFIAHVPANPWTNYIPARFGPSDATEMFVYCSGFASALAFGSIFLKQGFGLGSARILFRCFQVYWAHIAMFFAVTFVVVIGTDVLTTRDYVGQLNLHPFFNDPMNGIVGLMTLTYVPNYFDILPMYLVLLMMVPFVMALSLVHRLLPLAAVFALWLANQIVDFQLPAEWWSDRTWFFDPFGWALIFFTGFAIAAKWVKPPPPKRGLVIACAAFVIIMFPIYYWPIASEVEWIRAFREITWMPLFAKTDFGLLRWLHFMALAYLCVAALHGRREILAHPLLMPVVRVGQQALSTFICSMVLARVAGMVLDQTGRDLLSVALVNLSGFAILIGIAYMVRFFKSNPWRRPPALAPKTTPVIMEPSGPKQGSELELERAKA